MTTSSSWILIAITSWLAVDGSPEAKAARRRSSQLSVVRASKTGGSAGSTRALLSIPRLPWSSWPPLPHHVLPQTPSLPLPSRHDPRPAVCWQAARVTGTSIRCSSGSTSHVCKVALKDQTTLAIATARVTPSPTSREKQTTTTPSMVKTKWSTSTVSSMRSSSQFSDQRRLLYPTQGEDSSHA